jgi:hypothetical protein
LGTSGGLKPGSREFIETLQFLDDWLSRDEDGGTSLARFVGHPAYGVSQLRMTSAVSSSFSGPGIGSRPAAPFLSI